MKATIGRLALVAAAACTVSTTSAYDYSRWSAAGPGDGRSPCPGLNAMANHGILPHDGNGLTVPMLVQAMGTTYNLAPDVASVLAVGGLLSSTNLASLAFNLPDLDRHNFIEHDASLSRRDFHLGGDDHTFVPAVFNAFLAHFNGVANTSVPTCSKARFARVQDSSSTDPQFTYGPAQITLSYGETALYLQTLGNGGSNVPLTWVKSFFAQECLPYDLGWRTSSTPLTFASLNSLILRLMAESGEQLPEGYIITETAIKRAWLGLDPKSTAIPSAVQALLVMYRISL